MPYGNAQVFGGVQYVCCYDDIIDARLKSLNFRLLFHVEQTGAKKSIF